MKGSHGEPSMCPEADYGGVARELNTSNWQKCFRGYHVQGISYCGKLQRSCNPTFSDSQRTTSGDFRFVAIWLQLPERKSSESSRRQCPPRTPQRRLSPCPVLPGFLLKVRVNELWREMPNIIRSSAGAWFERFERSPGHHDHSAPAHSCDSL